ncbi:MAG: alpha/beta fold hydrolase [Colwellia sp.]|nr:alpha/beta fold hydrolase [Colwellia sp.]
MAFSPLPAYEFTTENQLNSRLNNEIKTLWHQGTFDHFNGVKNTRINYASFVKKFSSQNDLLENVEEERECLVIVPGRSEGYLKYQELSYDFYQLGFDIFIIDHRGQGISERLLPNKNKGYVESFEDYNEDLHVFISTIVIPQCTNKPYLLAHSMGGIISARYLQKHPTTIKAAVLSSPMIAINSGGIPAWLVKALIHSTVQLNQWFSEQPWYFLGQSDVEADTYHAKTFAKTSLMHSKLRYDQFMKIYQSTPEIQLGGVTVHWLEQALAAEKIVFENLNTLTTPTLVLQAGDDSIVDNEVQNEFCRQLHQRHPHSCLNGKPVVINNARHELLFESDKYRDQALQHIVNWFQKHRETK